MKGCANARRMSSQNKAQARQNAVRIGVWHPGLFLETERFKCLISPLDTVYTYFI